MLGASTERPLRDRQDADENVTGQTRMLHVVCPRSVDDFRKVCLHVTFAPSRG